MRDKRVRTESRDRKRSRAAKSLTIQRKRERSAKRAMFDGRRA
jgi:hypothetical protein